MEGLCCLFIPLLRTFVLLVPFSVLYGYFDGGYVALIPVVTSDVVGTTYLSSALGVVYFLHAVPYLVSPPIGGKSHKLFYFFISSKFYYNKHYNGALSHWVMSQNYFLWKSTTCSRFFFFYRLVGWHHRDLHSNILFEWVRPDLKLSPVVLSCRYSPLPEKPKEQPEQRPKIGVMWRQTSGLFYV